MSMIGSESRTLSVRDIVAGLSLGLAAPGIAVGKAVMAPFLLIALIAILPSFKSADMRRGFAARLRAPLGLALCGMFLLWLVSAVFSISFWHSFETVLRTGALVLIGLAYSVYLDAVPRARDLAGRTLIWATVAVVAFIVLCIYAGDRVAGFLDAVGGGDWSTAQERFKMFGSVTVCLLPVLIYFGFRLGGSAEWAALACVPLIALQLYADGVQPGFSGILGLVGSVGFVAVIAGIGRLAPAVRRFVSAGLIVAIVAGGITFFESLPKPPLLEELTDGLPFPDLHRQVIWGFAWNELKASPVIGVGPNGISDVPGAKDIIPGMNQEYIPAHPHSWLLEIGAETGVLGLAAFVLVLLMLIRRLSIRVISGDPAGWAAVFMMGVFWSSALVNFSIWAAWWIMLFIVLAALLPWREGRHSDGR